MITQFNNEGSFPVLLSDNDSTFQIVKSVESYEDCPKKSNSGGVEGTFCMYTRY